MAERLTFEGNFCEIARCRETRWGKHCPDGACSQRKVWERLKKYEDSDAIPVVRCKDCKYWGDEDGKLQRSDGVLFARCKIHNYLLDGRHTGWCPTENDFCSYGERKEGVD